MRVHRLTLTVLTAMAAMLLGAHAASAANAYIGFQGGLNFAHEGEFAGLDLTYDLGYAVGLTAGYKWDFNLRTEVEIVYRENDIDEFDGDPTIGDVNSLAFMVNGFYDIDTGTPWTPYVGGGLGLANVEIDSGGSDDDTVFAFQIGAGVGYDVTPALTVTVDYRFFGTEDADIVGLDLEYLNSTIMAGLRYNF